MATSALQSHPAYDVPVATEASVYDRDPDVAKARIRDHVVHLKPYTLGPMPVQEFIDRFLPSDTCEDRTQFLNPSRAFRSVPARANNPAGICKPLVSTLNRRTKHKSRCPGFVFDEGQREGSFGPKSPRPAICCYTSANHSTLQRTGRAHADLGYAELFIVVSSDRSRDYFRNTPSPQDVEPGARRLRARTTDKEKASELTCAFGEHIASVVEVFARQHRAFLFSISMAGSLARLFRWDRSGCVVTEPFDIREQPHLLCDFLWRFSRGPPTVRGHDVTVEIALPDEEHRFRRAVRAHVQSQLEVAGEELDKAVAVHYEPGRVFAIHLLPQHFTVVPENIRRFVVSRPVVTPSSLVGRGTRGYWALDTSTEGIVFVKDTWRFKSVDELEGDTLRRLVDLGVRNVPSMVWHGDVPRSFPAEARRLNRNELQQTKTHVVAAEPWVCRGGAEDLHISRRQHYRLVTGVAGYTLRDVRGADELLHAGHDVLTAMRDALAKDSRIHRDLSVGNIILVKHPDRAIRTGYLIDWEVSCVVDESGQSPSSGRVGTWAFVSIRMLDVEREDGNRHKFEDDMESLLYVVLYCALLWQPHNLDQQELTAIIQAMFDQSAVFLGAVEGGGGKSANALFRTYTERVRFDSAALQEWLTAVMDFHSPVKEPDPDDINQWTAEHLDTYWTTFLQSHTLERDNRVVHTLQPAEYRSLTPSAYTSEESLLPLPADIAQSDPQSEVEQPEPALDLPLQKPRTRSVTRADDAHALGADSRREPIPARPRTRSITRAGNAHALGVDGRRGPMPSSRDPPITPAPLSRRRRTIKIDKLKSAPAGKASSSVKKASRRRPGTGSHK